MDVNLLPEKEREKEKKIREADQQKKIDLPMSTPISEPSVKRQKVNIPSPAHTEIILQAKKLSFAREEAKIEPKNVGPKEAVENGEQENKRISRQAVARSTAHFSFLKVISWFKRRFSAPAVPKEEPHPRQLKEAKEVASQPAKPIEAVSTPVKARSLGVKLRLPASSSAPQEQSSLAQKTPPKSQNKGKAVQTTRVALLVVIQLVFFASSVLIALWIYGSYQRDLTNELKRARAENAALIEEQEYQAASARDEIRLRYIEKIRSGLARYFVAEKSYPGGQAIILGDDLTACLALIGWVSRDRCAIPRSPYENIIYLREVSGDPGQGVYLYSSQDGGKEFEILFSLEVGAEGYDGGDYVLTSLGVKKKI